MRGLPIKVKEHLEKAHDSAILAVEVYNKPAVKFKSGGQRDGFCFELEFQTYRKRLRSRKTLRNQ